MPRATSHQKLSHFQEDDISNDFLDLLMGSGEGYPMRWLPKTYVDLYKEASVNKPLQILNSPKWAQIEHQGCPNKDLIEHLRGSQELKTWETAQPPNVLLLQSVTPLTIGDMTLLLDAGDGKSWVQKAKILSASFAWASPDDDDRFLYRLLLSFIKELGKDSDEETVVPDIFDHRATPLWTERQIWVLFRTMLSVWKGGNVIFIFAAVERCPFHKRWLIDELVTFANANDRNFRIIINRKDDVWVYLKDNIDVYDIDVDSVVAKLVHGEAILNDFLERRPKFEIIRHELLKKVQDAVLTGYAGLHPMLRYLETAPIRSTGLSMRNEMEKFSDLSLWNVVKVLLDQIPDAKRNWASNILTWITYAHEPLTINSLSAALAIGDRSASLETWNGNIAHDLASDIEQGLPPIFNLDKDYVRFVDDELYRYFAKPDERYWHTPSHESDWTLCEKCIFYLSTENIITQYRSYFEDGQTSEILGDYHGIWRGMLPYAIRSWPIHYRAAMRKNCADHGVILKFLQNTNAVMAWNELYWEMEDPLFKQRRGLSSLRPLHIAIRFGFVEITQMLLNGNAFTDQGDIATDMSSAAQNGHAEILQKLLDKFKPDPSILHVILSDTSNIGSEEVLQTLLQYEDAKPLPRKVIQTLLNLIAENGWADDLTRFVLDLTANHDVAMYSDSETVTPLHHAANHGYMHIVKLLHPQVTMKSPIVQNDNNRSYSPLHIAAMRGHVDVLDRLVSISQTCLNLPGPKSRTALHLAAKNGFSHIVEILMPKDFSDHPQSANARDDDGSTPLHLACRNGFLESSLKLIRERGADVMDNEQNTILHAAAQGGNVTIILKLLENYRHLVDKRNKSGDTPLQVALRHKHEAVARIIMGDPDDKRRQDKGLELKRSESRLAGSLITDRNMDGKSALSIAMENGLERAIAIILRHKRMTKTTDGSSWGKPELLIASAKGYSSIVSEILISYHGITKDDDAERDLIPNGAEVVLDALELASYRGHLEVVKELLRHLPGVLIQLLPSLKTAIKHNHVDIVKYFGAVASPRTALFSSVNEEFMQAAAFGHVDMVCALLENGINVNCQDRYQNTALMLASYNCEPDVVQLLLLRKADTELRDDSQGTAISDAAAQGSVDCLKLLIKAGARANVQNVSGVTAIAQAVWYKHLKVVKPLLRADANVEIQDSFGHDALSMATGSIGILREILAVINPSKECLRRALIYAAATFAIDAAEILQSHGAMIEPGMWPLHNAIRDGQKDTVEYLLKQGAEKELVVRGQKGTPLQQAIYFGRVDIMDMLLAEKVNVNQEGGPYHTALHIAAFKDTTKGASIVQRLLQAGAKVDIKGGIWRTALNAAVSHSSGSSYSLTTARLLLNVMDDLRNHQDEQGRLPLHLAARTDDVELMKLVAPSPSQPWLELKDLHGRNPIHFAAMGGAFQVVQYMESECGFAKDDSTKLKDIHGWTPLHWACRGGSLDALQFFMQSSSDLDMQTCQEWSPRRIAVYHGNAKLISLIDHEPPSSQVPELEEGTYQWDTICDSCACVSIHVVFEVKGILDY